MGPRKPQPEILETEWDILEALWSAERATARQVRLPPLEGMKGRLIVAYPFYFQAGP